MLLKSIISVLIASFIYLSIPIITFNHIQNHSSIIKVFIHLRYAKLNSFITKIPTKIIAKNNTIEIHSSHKKKSKIDFNCHLNANRKWFGFTENLTSQLAGSIYFYCLNNAYKLSFPVGKSQIRLYRL